MINMHNKGESNCDWLTGQFFSSSKSKSFFFFTFHPPSSLRPTQSHFCILKWIKHLWNINLIESIEILSWRPFIERHKFVNIEHVLLMFLLLLLFFERVKLALLVFWLFLVFFFICWRNVERRKKRILFKNNTHTHTLFVVDRTFIHSFICCCACFFLLLLYNSCSLRFL